jgi:hypothetical protein
MNIKKPIAKKVAVAFPDAAIKSVPMPRPATNVKPINMDFKGLFRRLRKTTKEIKIILKSILQQVYILTPSLKKCILNHILNN